MEGRGPADKPLHPAFCPAFNAVDVSGEYFSKHTARTYVIGAFVNLEAMAPLKCKAMINVDLGEAYGNWRCGPDDELIPLIDHANIACGFHAGYVCLAIAGDSMVVSQYR